EDEELHGCKKKIQAISKGIITSVENPLKMEESPVKKKFEYKNENKLMLENYLEIAPSTSTSISIMEQELIDLNKQVKNMELELNSMQSKIDKLEMELVLLKSNSIK